jgi:dihydroorotate dehydrogenase (NAD+) catalytic subunit
MTRLNIRLGPLSLNNPVLVASGTYGYGDEFIEILPLERLGGIVTKGITLKPKEGNPPPRLHETPCGLLNCIGLENIGFEKFIKEKLPLLEKIGTALVVNVNGETIREFEELVERIDEIPRIDAVEINVSCPNVEKGGIEFGRNIELLESLISSLRSRTKKSLWVKLTPNFVDIVEEAKAAENGGADAVTVMNTLIGTDVDILERRFVLSRPHGGLSGPAILPVALSAVYRVSKSLKIPVIGVGGITDWVSALKFIMVGATAVQVGTANFLNPRTPFEIIDGIEKYMEREGIRDISEIRGCVQESFLRRAHITDGSQ